ncbi:putative transcriptional regulatory protein [Candidatus Protofrankia datiscae]|uniref:Putative transcriptional regulatory protein n=2 Tax=Frankiaceae TaxID=74712 RepID=F8AYE6_9ACTN|nr:Rv2175c family DNA-binding protein [Candidatus Protofrankia datiscae]AEH10449.1 putative transcriptional regulatory protein [Candidatus Protofrankia datiscae]
MTITPYDPHPGMTNGRFSVFTLTVEWLTLPDVADRLGIPITRVRQMVRDRKLLAVRSDGVLRVPTEFIQDGTVLKGLSGLLTVLSDAGFSDEESLDWLFREDPTLPGTPVRALAENRGREVKRRAQALAF